MLEFTVPASIGSAFAAFDVAAYVASSSAPATCFVVAFEAASATVF